MYDTIGLVQIYLDELDELFSKFKTIEDDLCLCEDEFATEIATSEDMLFNLYINSIYKYFLIVLHILLVLRSADVGF